MTSLDDLAPDPDFSDWMREQLEERQWTPQILATAAGIAPATLSNILKRKRQPGPDVVRALARVLGISQYDMFKKAGLIDEILLDDRLAALRYLRLLATIRDDDDRELAMDAVEALLTRVAAREKTGRTKPARLSPNGKSKP